MTKDEIVIASEAYRAGYQQACEDCVKVFTEIRRQAFEVGMHDFAEQMDGCMKQAVSKHFDGLHKSGEK